MKKSSFLVITLCILIVLIGCSENGKTNKPSVDSKTPSTEEVLSEIYTEEERRQITDHIFSIKHEGHLSDIQCYTKNPESHSKLFEISLKGLPVLIHSTAYVDEHRETLNGLMTYPNFCFGIVAMLHANEFEFYCSRPNSANLEIDWTTHYGEWLFAFFDSASEECPKVISSSETLEEKIETLANYGILAIPYVNEEIDKGNLEYEVFFTEIGLHLTTEEFADASCYDNNMELYYNRRYSEVRDSYPSPEDFDYKVWLSENEEDLDNLFKFLDAYCAEYEAEMAKNNSTDGARIISPTNGRRSNL